MVGLGYVGLPTALALHAAGATVAGIDASPARLRAIQDADVDLLDSDHERLAAALAGDRLHLTDDPAALAEAAAVMICVPTPVDEDRRPDLRMLADACATVVRLARPGQVLILTSTTFVGSTTELLVEPLARRGLRAGEDVHVAFAPERIDPGNARHPQDSVPRVLGGVTPACTEAAAAVLEHIAPQLHRVSSPEAAELSKLYENTFRAVNIALANELAGLAGRLDLDPLEVIRAAATKPYGYMPFWPSAGVGGHCIPCDPHYLLASVPDRDAPVIEQAMDHIARRPAQVADRAVAMLAADGVEPGGARALVVGAAYKPGVADTRESPAVEIMAELCERGLRVDFTDPLVDAVGLGLDHVATPDPDDYDIVVIATVHPDDDLAWLDGCARVLDGTYRVHGGRRREVV